MCVVGSQHFYCRFSSHREIERRQSIWNKILLLWSIPNFFFFFVFLCDLWLDRERRFMWQSAFKLIVYEIGRGGSRVWKSIHGNCKKTRKLLLNHFVFSDSDDSYLLLLLLLLLCGDTASNSVWYRRKMRNQSRKTEIMSAGDSLKQHITMVLFFWPLAASFRLSISTFIFVIYYIVLFFLSFVNKIYI